MTYANLLLSLTGLKGEISYEPRFLKYNISTVIIIKICCTVLQLINYQIYRLKSQFFFLKHADFLVMLTTDHEINLKTNRMFSCIAKRLK